MREHQEWLTAYIKRKMEDVRDPVPLELKRLHSWKVYENASFIADSELASPELVRSARLAALYHDIARFDQYRLFGTFKDAQSFDHGLRGVKILKQEKRFSEENSQIANLALTAVGLHNRRLLPRQLASKALAPVNIVRDADKLDILRVLDEHLKEKPYSPTVILSLPDEPDLHNPQVSQAVLNGECPSYGDLRSVNDFRVLLGAWFFAMNFRASRKLFIERPHAQNLVEALPDNRAYGRIKKRLLSMYEAGRKEMGI